MATSPPQITQLLRAWSEGDEAALGELIPLIYDELHRIAQRYMGRERADHTLQTTALLNEAYLRLIDARSVQWQNRAHFFAISAQLMRRILVDAARHRNYAKRGGEALRVSLTDAELLPQERDADLVALDEALVALAKIDPRQSRVVELRFFGGLSVEETAAVLRVSPETVMREWKFAKVWLRRELKRNRHAEGHEN
jgi:RNA polymerase sigma-70 factor, ECF subfamily